MWAWAGRAELTAWVELVVQVESAAEEAADRAVGVVVDSGVEVFVGSCELLSSYY